mmetsp:Transcript_22675/g.73376  ORF Transcript_22675/g.73376 Transcript_22675/m.73376 type:complete len:244 (-) Transcript_22675:436-1167(-)|eukprot:scaffold4262_cov139-Isochrysis_galbana.AAC.1
MRAGLRETRGPPAPPTVAPRLHIVHDVGSPHRRRRQVRKCIGRSLLRIPWTCQSAPRSAPRRRKGGAVERLSLDRYRDESAGDACAHPVDDDAILINPHHGEGIAVALGLEQGLDRHERPPAMHDEPARMIMPRQRHHKRRRSSTGRGQFIPVPSAMRLSARARSERVVRRHDDAHALCLRARQLRPEPVRLHLARPAIPALHPNLVPVRVQIRVGFGLLRRADRPACVRGKLCRVKHDEPPP